jgi:hypothetical protein
VADILGLFGEAVDPPPFLNAIDDIFGVGVGADVVNVTESLAVLPVEDVTVTCAVYEVLEDSPPTALDVAVVPVNAEGPTPERL